MTDLTAVPAASVPLAASAGASDEVLMDVGGVTRRVGRDAIAAWIGNAPPFAQAPAVYSTVSSLLGSSEAARGAGAAWQTRDGFNYREAASNATDQHVTTAGGVKLYVLPFWAGLAGGVYNVAAFGVFGQDVAGERAGIQRAINAASAAGGGTVYFPVPAVAYRIDGEIQVPIRVHLVGAVREATKFRVRSGSYPKGFAFLVNTLDINAGGNGEVTQWVEPYPNDKMPTFRNLHFTAIDRTVECIAFNGSFEAWDCHFQYFNRSIVGGDRYNDSVKLKNLFFWHDTRVSTYQVDLGNTGDAVSIDCCHFPNIGNSPNTPMRSIRAVNNSVTVVDGLLGDILLINCTSMTRIISTGADGGQWVLENTQATISDCSLSALQSAPAIRLVNTNIPAGFGYSVRLQNVNISHDIARGLYTPHEFDVECGLGYVVAFDGVYRRLMVAPSPPSRNLHGVRVCSSTGVGVAAFNDYSYRYSVRSVMRNLRMDDNSFHHEMPNLLMSLLTTTFAQSQVTFTGTTGTYYYKAVAYWDVGRAVARNDNAAEVSRAATNGGSAIGLQVIDSNFPNPKWVRVYRGTSSGSYNAYVDIPCVSVGSFTDTGPHLSGTPWISRAAGAVDAFNNFTLRGFGVTDGRARFSAAATPTAGTWSAGDQLVYPAPAAGGHVGEICVTAGTPGTWKTWGAISA